MARLSRWIGSVVGIALFAIAAVAMPAAAQTASGLDDVKKRGTLKVGWAVWFPYAYVDPNTKKVTGFSVDLMGELASAMEVKVEFVEDSWATLIAGLQANKFDLTIPMGITLKRALAVTYSRPFMQFQEGLMVLKKDADKYKHWRELDKAGMKITTTLGATPDIFLTKALTGAELVRAKDGATSLNQLLTGRANAWANSYEAFAKILKDRDDVAVVPGAPMGSVPVAFTVRQGDYHLRDWINYFIEEESKTGALLRTMKKHGMDETYLVDQASAPAPRN